MRWVGVVVVASGAALLTVMADTGRAENVVRWATANAIPTWEPTSYDTATLSGHNQVYEGLTIVDTDLSLHPGLATSWTLVRPDTWRFKLREGVHFHDGTPLTVEDVIFSVERARSEPSDVAYVVNEATRILATDEHTIEITTKQPELRLPVQFRIINIISKIWAERYGAELPARRDDASGHTFAHANGTGPFMLESAEPNGRAVLIRNPDWWGRDQYPHNIDRIIWSPEPDPGRRLALLLNGDIDLLQDVPPEGLDRLQGGPGIRLSKASGLLTIFLGPFQGGSELRTSAIKDRNPFADRRVRQALYQAIDVETLIKKTLGGLAVPAGMLAAPGENGYDADLDRRLPFDPVQARSLLSEAGYPHGFAVRLDCSQLRAAPCRELAAQLADIGLLVTANIEPFAQHKQRLAAGDTDLYLDAEMASFSFDSAEVLRETFHSGHVFWVGATGYMNPSVDALLAQIDRELSTYSRDALIEQVWRVVLDDIVVVPLYRSINIWAMRQNLDLPIGPIPIPRFCQARLTGVAAN